jgi:hypothetical protein
MGLVGMLGVADEQQDGDVKVIGRTGYLVLVAEKLAVS